MPHGGGGVWIKPRRMVKACAHELRWGWKAHSRQRKKKANKASLSAKLNSLFLSTHTLSRLHTFNRGVLPVLFSLDKSYHFLRAAEVDHPEDTIAEAPALSPSVSPSSPPSWYWHIIAPILLWAIWGQGCPIYSFMVLFPMPSTCPALNES